MDKKTILISLVIDKELHRKFKLYSTRKMIPMSVIIRQFLEQVVDEDEDWRKIRKEYGDDMNGENQNSTSSI